MVQNVKAHGSQHPAASPSHDLRRRRSRAADTSHPRATASDQSRHRFHPRRGDYAREFITSGDRVAAMLKSYADLQSDQHVLGIGSGIGRIARSLTTYLSTMASTVDSTSIPARGVVSALVQSLPELPVCLRSRRLRQRQGTGGNPRGRPRVSVRRRHVRSRVLDVGLHTSEPGDGGSLPGGDILRPAPWRDLRQHVFVMDGIAVDAMQSGRADRRYVRQGDGAYVADLDNPNFGIGFTPDVINTFHETTVSPSSRQSGSVPGAAGRRSPSSTRCGRGAQGNGEHRAQRDGGGAQTAAADTVLALQRRPPASSRGYLRLSRASVGGDASSAHPASDRCARALG